MVDDTQNNSQETPDVQNNSQETPGTQNNTIITPEEFGDENLNNLVGAELGISDDAIAVKVNYDGEIMNDIPHITVATPLNGKPVNSNFIRNWKPIEPFNVTGTLNAFMKK